MYSYIRGHIYSAQLCIYIAIFHIPLYNAVPSRLGKCVPFSRSRCPAQVSLLALILVIISKDGIKINDRAQCTLKRRIENKHLHYMISYILEFDSF